MWQCHSQPNIWHWYLWSTEMNLPCRVNSGVDASKSLCVVVPSCSLRDLAMFHTLGNLSYALFSTEVLWLEGCSHSAWRDFSCRDASCLLPNILWPVLLQVALGRSVIFLSVFFSSCTLLHSEHIPLTYIIIPSYILVFCELRHFEGKLSWCGFCLGVTLSQWL